MMGILNQPGASNSIYKALSDYVKDGGGTNLSLNDFKSIKKVVGNTVATNDEFIEAYNAYWRMTGKADQSFNELTFNPAMHDEYLKNAPMIIFQFVKSLQKINPEANSMLYKAIDDVKKTMSSELLSTVNVAGIMSSMKYTIKDKDGNEQERSIENVLTIIEDVKRMKEMITDEFASSHVLNSESIANVIKIKANQTFSFSSGMESSDKIYEMIGKDLGLKETEVSRYLQDLGIAMDNNDAKKNVKNVIDLFNSGKPIDKETIGMIEKANRDSSDNERPLGLYFVGKDGEVGKAMSVEKVLDKLAMLANDAVKYKTSEARSKYELVKRIAYLADKDQLRTMLYLSKGLNTKNISMLLKNDKISKEMLIDIYESKSKTRGLETVEFLNDEIMDRSVLKVKGGC
jgi:hypothetical protein